MRVLLALALSAAVCAATTLESSCLLSNESTCGEFSACQAKINMTCVQAQPHLLHKGGEIELVSKGYVSDAALNITDTMMLVILRKNNTMVGSTVGPSCERFVSEFPGKNNDVILIESSGLPCIMSPGEPVALRTSMYMPDGEGEYELNVAVFTLHHTIACIAALIAFN